MKFCILSALMAGLAAATTESATATVLEENQGEETPAHRNLPHFRTWNDIYYTDIELSLGVARRRLCPLSGVNVKPGDSCYSERSISGRTRGAAARTVHFMQLMLEGGVTSYAWLTKREDSYEGKDVFVVGIELQVVDEDANDDEDATRRTKLDLNQHAARSFHVYVAGDDDVPAVLSDREDTLSKTTLDDVAFLQKEASPFYLPASFQASGDNVQPIDEVACMILCLAGCVAADQNVPCWQICSSTCAWLVLTPL